jgi:glycosyltransferase involved in cell wall biosynthesis
MRVGLLIYGSIDTISGGYLYDRKLVSHLNAQRDYVEIISLPWRGYGLNLLDNFSSRLRQRLEDLQIDVLIQDELSHPSLALLNHDLRISYPITALVHHLRCKESRPTWKNSLYRLVEGHYLDSVDAFIFNSQTTRRSVDQVSQIGKRPYVIATPAGDRFDPQIDFARIRIRANQHGPLRLVFIGNLTPRKGLHTLIDALAWLPAGSCQLDVVGETRINPLYWRRMLCRVARHKLNDTVRFHSALEDEDLETLLVDSHILVVPSSYEGFGIVYLEAMSFGLPAIGTTQGAAGEIIIPGENGYLIEPGDSQFLAGLLENLHRDRRKLTALSINAKNRYSTFPGWTESLTTARNFLADISQN